MPHPSVFKNVGTAVHKSGYIIPLKLAAFFLVFLFFLTKMSSPVSAADYYVSTGGDDGHDGSYDYPWLTLTHAADTAVAGDTVYIEAGAYYETLSPANSGTSGSYITFRNYNSDTVVIDAQDGTRGADVSIIGKSYIQIIGLITVGANDYNVSPRSGVYVGDSSSNVIIDGVTSYDNWYGIRVYGKTTSVSNVTVKNCNTFIYDDGSETYIGNTQHGIFVYRKVYDSVIGPNNRAAYNTGMGDSYGIEVGTADADDQSYSPQRIIIYDNEADHNEVQGIRVWNSEDVQVKNNYTHDNGATGIQLEGGDRNVVVEDNLSENNAQIYEYETGAWVYNATNVLVRNNVLRSNKIGLIISSSSRVTAHNNSVYDNNRGAVNLANAGGLVINNPAEDIYVANNTLYNNGYSGGQRGGFTLGQTDDTCDNIKFFNNIVSTSTNPWDLYINHCANYTFDYNNYYNTRALSVYYTGSTINWASYLATSLQDANTITDDPVFTDTGSDDYTLQETSPDIDSGNFLAKTVGSGSGTVVTVDDAGYFSDGVYNSTGDTIKVGDDEVTITGINYSTNELTVDADISWNNNDDVSFAYSGDAPDIGAYEYTETPTPTPTPTLTPSPTPSSSPKPTGLSYSSSSSATAPGCGSSITSETPDLFEIRTGKVTATLYFTPPSGPYSSIYISYSRDPNSWEYGVEYNQGEYPGVLSYTIFFLHPNTKYYFRVRVGNGCATGNWGNIMSATTTANVNSTKVFYKNIFVPISKVIKNIKNNISKNVNLVPNSNIPEVTITPIATPTVFYQPTIFISPTPVPQLSPPPKQKKCFLWIFCW
jgi:parallel beta-helix repeat protein